MDDARVWSFEEKLWVGDPDTYESSIDPDCLMGLPATPFVFQGQDAIEAVKATPRWAEVIFSDQKVSRPQEGLIVIAYSVTAGRAGVDPYKAHCTSTYRRLGHDEWRVVQHQQSPQLAATG